MDNSNYIPGETRSVKLLYLLILVGLVGILMALLSMNIPLFAVIITFPFICTGGILILRYPQLMLFIIFTINYFTVSNYIRLCIHPMYVFMHICA